MHGQCRRALLGQANRLLSGGRWVIMPVRLGGRQLGGWPNRGSGQLLAPPRFFTHVGREPWCSRGPCRDPVAAIFRWETARTGTIGGPAWTCVGLHTPHTRPVCISLGYHDGYRSGGRGVPHVPGTLLQTKLQTLFIHGRVSTRLGGRWLI